MEKRLRAEEITEALEFIELVRSIKTEEEKIALKMFVECIRFTQALKLGEKKIEV